MNERLNKADLINKVSEILVDKRFVRGGNQHSWIPSEVYMSHKIHLLENSCQPLYVGEYRDDFETDEEFEKYIEEDAVDYITELEFISFEEFVEELENYFGIDKDGE